MMSGTAPAANGAVGMGPDPDWAPPHLLAGELTAAGYQTEMIGKSHVRGRGSSRWRYGFEHVQIADSSNGGDYAEWLADRGVRDQHPGYAHGVSSNAWVGRPHHLPEELLHTFWVVDRAIHFLEHRDDSQPFFLNLSFIDPHPPFTPPRHYYDRYIDRDLPEPRWATGRRTCRASRYRARVSIPTPGSSTLTSTTAAAARRPTTG